MMAGKNLITMKEIVELLKCYEEGKRKKLRLLLNK